MKTYPKQQKFYCDFIKKYNISAGMGSFPEDLNILLEEAEKLKPNSNYVEFGTAQGTSFFSVANFRSDINCYGIDDTTKPKFKEILSDFNFKNVTLFLDKKAEELCKEWNKEIDLLFIDAHHYFPNIFWDFVGWWSHIRNGGTMIWHDFEGPNKANAKFEVGEALMIFYKHPKYTCYIPSLDDGISSSMFIIRKI